MSPTLLEPLTVPASGVEDESADRKVIARCGGVEWSSADLLLFYFFGIITPETGMKGSLNYNREREQLDVHQHQRRQ